MRQKYSKVTVEVLMISPKRAKDLLAGNTRNRDLKKRAVAAYSAAMVAGHWKLNGETISVDSNGNLTNGQSRLTACVNSKVSFPAILVEGLEPESMFTVDTGTKRHLGDVLKMEGFKYNTQLAAMTSNVIQHDRGAYSLNGLRGSVKVTTTIGLEYVRENSEHMYKVLAHARAIKKKSNTKIMSETKIAYQLYVLCGYEVTEDAVDFMKSIVGINIKEGTASAWVYSKLLKANAQGTRLSQKWITGIIIRAWNYYNEGDPVVTALKYNVMEELPSIDH